MVSLYTDCQYIYMYISVKVMIFSAYTPVLYIHCCEGFDGEFIHMCIMYVCRYMNDPVNALHHFNQVRRDGEWGEKALFNMVKICLNPDDDCLG